MSKRNDYSDDEWNAITTAPGAAGLVIVLGTVSGPTGTNGTPIAVDQAITRSTVDDAPEIVKVLVEIARSHGGQPELPQTLDGDRNQRKEALIAIVRLAVRAVETKSPAEVEPFKAWLASVAAKTFHAAKVTNPPAIESATLNSAEQDAIRRLADVLAWSRSRPVGSPMRRPATAAVPSATRTSNRVGQRRAAS